MKTEAIFSMIALMAIVASMAVPAIVSATEVTIDTGTTHIKAYDMDRHGWVSWSWTVEGSDSVDFWVEDPSGDRHDEEYAETWDAGVYYVDSPGRYYLKWRNDGSSPIVVDYTISSFGANPVEEAANTLMWVAVMIAIIIIVVIAVVVVAVVMAGKKKTPDAQQQQYYQQQQYQQPQQQPQQPQDPQQPGQQQYQQPPQQQYQQPQQQPPRKEPPTQ